MNTMMATTFASLISAAPVLLVYLIGIVLAVINWPRWPQVCVLVLSGSVLLFVTTLVMPMLQGWIISNRGPGASAFAQMLTVVAFFGSFLRAAGFGLLLWAAFAGRPAAEQLSAFQPLPPRMPPGNR